MTTPPEMPAAEPADELRKELNDLREQFNKRMQDATPEERDAARSAISGIGDKWWLMLTLGILSIIAGILSLMNPVSAILSIALIFAIWLVISGIGQIVRGFSDDLDGGSRVLLVISGALSLILGIMCFRGKFQAVEILVIFMGISFLIRGIMEVIAGIQAKGESGRGWMITMGLVTAVSGIVLLVWPGMSAISLAYVAGVMLLFIGSMEILGSFKLRSLSKEMDEVAARI